MAVVETASPSASKAALYKWQTWVHVGPDAENCADVNEQDGTVECHNPLHFHCWVRLPNAYLHQDLREKALAAKARRMALARDVESDVGAILDHEIETTARRGEGARADLTDALLQQDWWRFVLGTLQDMGEKEEWKHIDEDRRRFAELQEMEEKDRPKDEFELLQRHLEEYEKAYQEHRRGLEQPLRDELAALDISALLDRFRDMRVEREGSDIYKHVYSEWQAVYCTYRQPEGELLFSQPSELQTLPDAVEEALSAAYDDLEREKGGLGLGNS